MLNVAEYQETIKSEFDSKLDYATYNQEQESILVSLKMELDDINSEISLIDKIIKDNNSFSKFIECKSIYVVSPNG
jgi:hypothetical protein